MYGYGLICQIHSARDASFLFSILASWPEWVLDTVRLARDARIRTLPFASRAGRCQAAGRSADGFADRG